jgi:hypothetical protein
MKKNYIIPMLAFATIISLAASNVSQSNTIATKFEKSHRLNSSGAPAGRTGAPGESNCTACHSGSVQNGDAINSVTLINGAGQEVTSFLPDSVYTVRFNISQAASKRGFQLVALNPVGSSQAGVITGNTAGGTSRITSGGKQYINHTGSSTGFTSGWTFTWQAPADVDNVRFYAASNVTNNNGTASGDQIFTSQHNFSKDATASIKQNTPIEGFTVAHQTSVNALVLNFNANQAGKGHLNVIDVQGKSVFNTQLGDIKSGQQKETVLLPKELNSGIYFVHLFVNNHSVTKKIQIQ